MIKSRIDTIEVDVFTPDNWNGNKLVICCHGFNSGKNSDTYSLIGNELLTKDIAYAKFSLPYHAERRNDYDDFTLENCISDSEQVEKTIREKYPNTRIGILGTSFGGYLTLLRLKKFKHDYFSIVLKSPAIKMDKIFKAHLAGEEFDEFKKQGYGINHHKADDMRINYSFYEELEKNKIFDLGEYEEKILIYHGTLDDTAPYEDSLEFANQNKNTKLISLKNENHRYSIEALNKFCKNAAKYFFENK